MKPHPRTRKSIKWIGAVITVLLIAAWIGSEWWYVAWGNTRGNGIWIMAGSIQFGRVEHAPYDHLVFRRFLTRSLVPTHWWFSLESHGQVWLFEIPLWTLAAASLLPTMIAFRLDTLARHRARTTHCPKCNYDRTGLAPQSVCPECGTPSPSPPPTT